MAMELERGVVSDLTEAGDKGPASCRVGGKPVVLHRDLLSNVAEGEEIAVAGPRDDEALVALAVNNITHHRGTQVDGSNYILAMGLAGFVWILFFVLAMQHMVAGDTAIGSSYGALSLAGLVGVIVTLQKVIAIRRAAAQVRYLD